MLTRLSTRFPCVLAESLPVIGFLPPVSSAFPSQRLLCGDGTFCWWQRQKKPSRLSLGPQTEQTATCFLQMLTQKSTKFISTLRRSPAGTAWSDSRDSHNHKETANPVALSSWGLYLWATGTVSRAACGCLQERKHMSAFATS